MKMRRCLRCKLYSFKEICPRCNEKTVSPNPPSFSPQDRYGKYRRKFIQESII